MDYEAILNEAHAAAAEAVKVAATRYDEMRGACGFAWVKISGNEPLARHCRKQLKAYDTAGVTNPLMRRALGEKSYTSGWEFWNPGNHGGQRVDIKEAGAKAFRDVLGKYGIRADAGSRLD
jgi:hypothetical protein